MSNETPPSAPPGSPSPPRAPSPDEGSTVMMDAPPPEVMAAAQAAAEEARAKVKARETQAMQAAQVDMVAQLQAAAASMTPLPVAGTPATGTATTPAAAPAPSSLPAGPIAEARTAILDGNNPEMLAIKAQMAAAAAAKAGAPPAASHAYSPGAPAAAAGPPAGPIAEARTAILDGNDPEMLAIKAQMAAAASARPAAAPAPARAAASSSAGSNLPPPPAPPPPSAGGAVEARTMMLSAPVIAPKPAAPVAPMPDLPPPPASRAWLKWVIGPGILLATAGATFGIAGKVHSVESVRAANVPPPPPPKKIGRIRLQTLPPSASVTIDDKPHPKFTPTTIEGTVGESVHVVVTLAGYKPSTHEVMFADAEQSLTVPLAKDEAVAPAPGALGVGAGVGADVKDAKEGKESKTAKHGGAGAKGTIAIFVKPSADVKIDGRKVGQTPLASVELAVGKHTIELSNETLKKKEKVKVQVKAGENPEVRRNWVE